MLLEQLVGYSERLFLLCDRPIAVSTVNMTITIVISGKDWELNSGTVGEGAADPKMSVSTML